jgi:hypothetical protein
MRYTPIRCTPIRYVHVRHISKMHAHEVHAREIQACEVYAHEIHAHKTPIVIAVQMVQRAAVSELCPPPIGPSIVLPEPSRFHYITIRVVKGGRMGACTKDLCDY